jgi:uncharacterized membrane protein
VSALTCREDVYGPAGGARRGQRDDVERLFGLIGDPAKQELLQLEDAAYVYRDDKGKVRIHQAISLTGAGAASGALWGTLIGLIFLNPPAGLAIRVAGGAVAGKLAAVGISDDTIKQIASQPRGRGRRS